jgi:hypothetical protein
MYFACSPDDGTIVAQHAARDTDIRYTVLHLGGRPAGRDSVFVIATGYGLGGLGIESR